jgi:hypothetical protein
MEFDSFMPNLVTQLMANFSLDLNSGEFLYQVKQKKSDYKI